MTAMLLIASLLATASASVTGDVGRRAVSDWLVVPIKEAVKITERPDRNEIVMTNGLMSRTFRTAPNFATVEYLNLMTGATIFRRVGPEASVELDGKAFEIGGLTGQPEYAYLDPTWLADMKSSPEAFQFLGYKIGKPLAPYEWKPARHSPETPWPPVGARLTVLFQPPEIVAERYQGLIVSVHYEIYEGIPAMAKWVTIANDGDKEIELGTVKSEILHIPEREENRISIWNAYWDGDSYPTSYSGARVLVGAARPAIALKPGEQFAAPRVIELLHDNADLDRQSLARRRVYRALAPQVTENPIFFHLLGSKPEEIRKAVDHCAEVGFEMIILSFGSGFNIESEDPAYIAQFKELVEYARSKGIELGGYTLMSSSRVVGADVQCISPETGKPTGDACLATEWADGYFRRMFNFADATGIKIIEADGPYYGQKCASTTHKHHRNVADSHWRQQEMCNRFLQECRKRGIYINAPSSGIYFEGNNKAVMGYVETTFSLPRWRQILIARQYVYDGTYEQTPSMGWMFAPLVEYHGGGGAATIEPLSEHLQEYEWYLAEYFGSGVMAAYRGTRLFDTDKTKALVKKWVDFYKKYRTILDSDIIHVRRADGRQIDCMMHVNSQCKERALAMVFNPTDSEQATTLKLPLYYTGLTDKARIREKEGKPVEYKLDREYNVYLPVRLGPKGITWFVVE